MPYVFFILSLCLTLHINASSEGDLDVWAGDYKLNIQETKVPKGLVGAPTLTSIITTPHNHLWISYGNGSGHTFTKVYSLKNGLKFIMSLQNRFAPVIQGKYLHFVDKRIGSWFTMFPGVWYGPEPRIVYEFKNGKYKVARKMMKKKPLSAKDLQKKVKAILQSTHFILQPENRMADHFTMMASQPIYSSPTYWCALFDLAYGGNMKQAVEVIEKVFASETRETKDQCIKDFKAILETSPYWEEIQKI